MLYGQLQSLSFTQGTFSGCIQQLQCLIYCTNIRTSGLVVTGSQFTLLCTMSTGCPTCSTAMGQRLSCKRTKNKYKIVEPFVYPYEWKTFLEADSGHWGCSLLWEHTVNRHILLPWPAQIGRGCISLLMSITSTHTGGGMGCTSYEFSET